MSDHRRVHRFRDHAVAGVNWRPTRFVDEVPSLRVCCLCRMIPKTVLALPCGHLLCQSCLAASSHGSGGRCPLDREPFKEAECSTCDLATRSVNALKVHCWNDGHGCKFEGAMEIMLRHYEIECTFHAVECFRCGEQVLHRELPTHYEAGCSAAVCLTSTKDTLSVSQALTRQDVTAALVELKTLLKGANQELLLPAIQSQVNELTERIRNLESRSATITHAVAATATSDMSRIEVPSPLVKRETSRQNPTEEASTSSTSRSSSGEKLMPQQLGPLVDLTREVIKGMRKTSSQDYPQHAITYVRGNARCQLELGGMLPTAVTWREVRGTMKYILTLENFFYSSLSAHNLADATVLHTRDAYLTFKLFGSFADLRVDITFHGMRGESKTLAPVFFCKVYCLNTGRILPISMHEELQDCKHDRNLWTHRGLIYTIGCGTLSQRNDRVGIKVELELCHQ
ncbi:uncharacterized protein LOC119186750 [Rhipicephalus microplus]|uniref:uncharacterized protein LOC119186750 n=1 Tax=Rhipicephalus microplus TaxID=6941 RepID=UPI003F6D29CC